MKVSGEILYISKKFDPETFLLTCVIHKKVSIKKKFELFERIPGNLEK